MNHQGTSESWTAQKTRAVALFDVYAKAKSVASWAQLDEAGCTGPELYSEFAEWLTNMYTFGPEDKFLKGSNVVNYLCILVNLAKNRFGSSSSAATLFFTCLEVRSSTSAAQWLSGMKRQIKRTTFEREKEDGSFGDNAKVRPLNRSKTKASLVCSVYL